MKMNDECKSCFDFLLDYCSIYELRFELISYFAPDFQQKHLRILLNLLTCLFFTRKISLYAFRLIVYSIQLIDFQHFPFAVSSSMYRFMVTRQFIHTMDPLLNY